MLTKLSEREHHEKGLKRSQHFRRSAPRKSGHSQFCQETWRSHLPDAHQRPADGLRQQEDRGKGAIQPI